jgi:general secretion pathway protein A
MYQRFYGLNALPFELTTNPRYLLLTPTHKEALSTLEHGIRTRKPVTLLVGEAGTGKTTLLRKALTTRLESDGVGHPECIYINNPTLSRKDFFLRLATDVGLDDLAKISKTALLQQLEETLLARRGNGRATALVVDEAQCLPDELLEELRLLANIESDDGPLMPIVLAGQPELAARLNEYRLRQLNQRIALRCQLSPFDLPETAGYIVGRLRLAGGDAAMVFTRDAVVAIHRASRGISRVISVVCDNALLTGFALQRRPIDADVVAEVCSDLGLHDTVEKGVDSNPGPTTKSVPTSEPPSDPPAVMAVHRPLAAVTREMRS